MFQFSSIIEQIIIKYMKTFRFFRIIQIIKHNNLKKQMDGVLFCLVIQG
jgi:hypothetical protein